MELFDKKFVHFMWDDELEDKVCFVADNIADLIFAVRNDGKCGVKTNALRSSSRASLPFLDSILNNCYPFAYYDENYEWKKAFNEGKKVQYQILGGVDWGDINSEEALECRIAEERTFRIKPECPCEDGIDSKACVGCEHSEDGKPHTFENYHCYICDKSDKKYRPYINSVEMIADFIARFKADCPPYEEPSIWVKNKADDSKHLVTSFVPNSSDGSYVVLFDYTCNLDELFNEYIYLDGTPCGMEVKE